jgi:hypothetical protein
MKKASLRHSLMDLFREACYFYYNSIRMQLAEKERRNTISYIGFVIGKDINTFTNEIPENITLQNIV